MTALPTVAYPSHLSDGSLATDPWPGFDLHPIRSTPEGSPIGGLAEREVEPGDAGRQRTHRPRAASSAYSSLLVQKHARPPYWLALYLRVSVYLWLCIRGKAVKKNWQQKKAQLLVQQPLIANLDGALFLVKGEKYLHISPRITYSKWEVLWWQDRIDTLWRRCWMRN